MKHNHRIAIAVMALIGTALAACDGVRPAPSDSDVRVALARYYEEEGVRWRDAASPEPETESRRSGSTAPGDRPDGGADTDTDTGSDADEDIRESIIIDDEKCVRLRVIKRRRNGEVVEERVELPCDIADTVEAGVAAGLRALTEAVKGVSTAVDHELRRFHVTEVADAGIIACVPAGDRPGHVCDVDAELVYGDDDRRSETLTGRFVRGPDGWRVLSLEPAR